MMRVVCQTWFVFFVLSALITGLPANDHSGSPVSRVRDFLQRPRSVKPTPVALKVALFENQCRPSPAEVA